MTLHQACNQTISFDTEWERRSLPLYPRSNRGLVFVTNSSRKQNLFFQNKFIVTRDRTDLLPCSVVLTFTSRFIDS
jgi:hypothetical protein